MRWLAEVIDIVAICGCAVCRGLVVSRFGRAGEFEVSEGQRRVRRRRLTTRYKGIGAFGRFRRQVVSCFGRDGRVLILVLS